MDLNALVRLIYAKHELMLGVSMTLLLIVTVLLLVRSVVEDRQAEKKSESSGDLDAKTLNTAIEGAMKKVLTDKGIQGAIAGAAAIEGSAGSGVSAPEAAELKKTLTEKEAKIAALMSDIEALKVAAESAQPAVDGGVAPGVDIAALQAKLVELQAKLAEYEIIEDDIADLSLYKEENKKLKAELANLKAVVETAQTQVHAANASVEAVPRADDPVQIAQTAVKAPTAPPEKFELDKNDSVMNEFAQALSGVATPEASPEVPAPASPEAPPEALSEAPQTQALESALVVSAETPLADPQAAIDAIMLQAQAEESPSILDEALDTNKLQSEVSKLAAELESLALEADSESSVLEESLDTDKLMKELAGSDSPVEPVSAVKPNPPTANVEDDLLAEFKDIDFQNSKTTKGS